MQAHSKDCAAATARLTSGNNAYKKMTQLVYMTNAELAVPPMQSNIACLGGTHPQALGGINQQHTDKACYNWFIAN